MKSFFLFICFSFWAYNISAQTFADPNFAAVPIGGGGWDFPTGATFSQDGQKLFVWQKGGKVFVCQRNGSGDYIKQVEPVIDLTTEVANWDAHGLVGFTLDPNFQSNGLIYLMYVVNRHHLLYFGTPSYNPNITINGQATIGRVTRYKTITSGSNLVADLSTRKILIGETKSTGMPILHHSHGVGSLAFAADGTLLATIGDAASYEGIDAGNDNETFFQQALDDGIIRPAENVGAFRSQLLNSMSGKLLRIDPQTGDGIPSNPYYSDSQPRAPKSRVWALGIRNSFRIHIKPGTGSHDPAAGDIGEVYLGDVGFASFEEMNIAKAPGTNFGWPIYEGNEYTIPLDGVGGITYKDLDIPNLDEPNPLYGIGGCTQQYFYFRQLIKQANPDDNKTIYNPCNSSQPIGTDNRYYHRRPTLEWSHAHPWARVGIFNGNTPAVAMIGSAESQVVGSPFSGQCSVGGTTYTGNTYPAQYRNTYFQADFAGQWIKRVSLDFTDVITRVDDFATGFKEIVCITQNPINGTLVTVQMNSTSGVKEIVYGGNQPPVAKPVANVVYGSSPLSVNFTGSNSFDESPGGSIVSYSWNFGGGSPATSNVANPGNIVFTESSGNPKKFVVKLTVTDNGGATHTDSVIISVNNTPPVVNITSPIKNSVYKPGSDTLYACTATVSDAQHGGAQLKYEWQTILRHSNHEHREAIDNAVNTNTLIQRVGFYGSDVYYWLIELTVTDAAGLSTKDSAKIFPDLSNGSDITPPLVSSVSPVNGATAVEASTSVSAIFDEAIDPSTVTGATFQLKDPDNNVIAAGLNTTTNQITLTPSEALTGSAVYTAIITGGSSGVKDLAGNALANNYSWNFTTAVVDVAAPTITSVLPVNGATGVNTNATVSVNFNEAINAATVNGTTIQLKSGATVIAASVNTLTNQITLTPSASLAVSTEYTVTIKGGASGVKDEAGNALTTDYNWSFTTGTVITQPLVSIQSLTTKTGTAATVHSLTGVPAGALLVLATTADAAPSNSNVSSSPSLTWMKRSDAGAVNSDNAEIWTALYTAGGSITVTSNWGNEVSQSSVCYVVLNAEPVLDGAFATAVLQSSPSVTINTTRDNSIIFGCTADWKSVNGATRTLRDAATERLYFKDGNYTTYHYTKAAPTTGAYTEGVSVPTGQQASTALLEIRGTAVPAGIPPTVTTHPTSQTRCAETSASFTSAADGTPAPTVQWQESTNGTTWNDIIGATNVSLTFTTSAADNNKQYRAVWTNSVSSVNSDPVTLTVNSIPVTPTITVANNCENSVMTAESFSGSLLWSNGATTTSTTVTTAGTYTVTQTVNGCTSATGSGIAAPKLIPQLSGSLAATVVSGTVFTHNPASTIAGTTFAWSRAIVTGISNAATNGTGSISETLINTTSSPVNVTYAYTLTDNGCTSTQNVVVTVNPVPTGNCTINNTSLTSNFNGTAIPAGRYIWFNSSFDPGPLSIGTDPVTVTISNGVITFTANNVLYTLNVPNARIRFDATVTSASTQFINNVWETVVPRSYTNDIFMSGLSYPVPVNFPGNYMNVKWTSDISIDKAGISLDWRWAAATYTTFADHAGVNVKPINGSTQNPYANSNRAGTPENFKSFVVGGAKGTGGTNYTGSFTAVSTANCTGNSLPATPTVIVVNNCGNSVLTAGSFTGSLLWSNGATTTSITVTTAGNYTVTQTVNGSTSAAGSGIAAPKLIPQLSGSLAATVASGTVFTYNPASTIAETTFAWSRAIVAGISNAATNGTGSISETLFNTTSSPVTVTYAYTLTANGCTSTQNVVLTVNPVSTVNCTINNTSLTTNFNGTAIPAGRYIWFNSSFNPGPLGTGTDPVTINITNGVITFTANSVLYTLNVPNARIRFDATVTSASTQFINNVWETVVPHSYTNDIFMSGLSYLVPVNFPGNYMNVKWTSDISIDRAGISLDWRWAAATYTTFADHGGVNVKPINGSTQNPYANSNRAGTPENFKSFVVSGAKGTGGTNYTGSFSAVSTATCTITPAQRPSMTPLITRSPLSIDSLSKEELAFNVMPNPSKTYFNLAIRGNSENPVQVRVTNVFGQTMEKHEKIASNTVLKLGHKLTSGTYFVEIIRNDQRRIMKIIKVN